MCGTASARTMKEAAIPPRRCHGAVMKRRNSIVAASALALGACAFTATAASAQQPPDTDSGGTAAAPTAQWLQVDDAGVEVIRAGASAIGGAGVALGGVWLYRRRHAPVG
jgi:hypothetical protein